MSRLLHEEHGHGCFEWDVRPDIRVLLPQRCEARDFEHAEHRPILRGRLPADLSGEVRRWVGRPDSMPMSTDVSQTTDLVLNGCSRSRRGTQGVVAVKPGPVRGSRVERFFRSRQGSIKVFVEELSRGCI